MYSNYTQVQLEDALIQQWKIRNSFESSSNAWHIQEDKCHEFANVLREKFNFKNEDLTRLYNYHVGD